MADHKPTYTLHALERMAQRNISEAEVEQAIAGHHTSYTDKTGNPIYVAHVAGRRIKVVVQNGSSPPHVITTAD